MGVHQTAPGFATFIIKPKLGSLTHAAITVPTLRGYINVTATPGNVAVHVPCNSVASLCLPRSAQDTLMYSESHITPSLSPFSKWRQKNLEFELWFVIGSHSTFGATGGPNQNTSRVQYKQV